MGSLYSDRNRHRSVVIGLWLSSPQLLEEMRDSYRTYTEPYIDSIEQLKEQRRKIHDAFWNGESLPTGRIAASHMGTGWGWYDVLIANFDRFKDM